MSGNNQKLIHTFAALAYIGQEITGKSDFGGTMRTSLHLLLGSLAIMRGGIARFDPVKKELNFIAARGLEDDFPLLFDLDAESEKEFLHVGLTAIDVNSHAVGWNCFVRQNLVRFAIHEIELVVPLTIHEELVGVVMLGGKVSGEAFSSDDKEIICAMCRHIGVGIQQKNVVSELNLRAEENLRLYESLRFTYKVTVESFATAIDLKEKHTEGHSKRVGVYSEIIAEELGWNEKRVEGIAVAGYLHDVGKLVIDRDIINSPTRIVASENSQLSKHPIVGYEILAPIEHPFADVPLAAKHHHERLDGRGYPDGLRDHEIPYIAKIVSLADSFDAMTTNHPYKHRRPATEVVEDLQRSAGGQFAPELVAAFCHAWLKEINGETKRKRILEMLGKSYCQSDKIAPLLKNALNEIRPTTRFTLITTD